MARVRSERAGSSSPLLVEKSNQLVEARLAQAHRRIRKLQILNALLVLALITVAYLAIMVMCGHLGRFLPAFQLSLLAKQLLFAAYLAAVFVSLGFALIRPLFRVVNPYYVAKHFEQVVPNSKNSIINWLDLRRRDLPGSIRAALCQRAAGDLEQADVTRAISGRNTVRLAVYCGFLMLGLALFLGILAWLHYPALALVKSAFPPFGPALLLTRTQLEIIQPPGGNLTLTIPQPVRIEIRLSGRKPDPRSAEAVRLLLRSDRFMPFEELPLEPMGGDNWHTIIPLTRVEEGFYYKVAGGDAETDEHRVLLLPAPVITRLDVSYRYRPYVCRPDRLLDGFDGNIKELRGTEVTLTAHTNCPVVEGFLALEPVKGKGQLFPAEVLPNGMRFRFVLDQSGGYRVRFKTRQQGTDGPVDRHADSRNYLIEAVPDDPPIVILTKPEPETIALPANGLLSVEGRASDDIGVKEISLHMKLDHGPTLKTKPYRPNKSFRRPDGSYPVSIDYKDFVELGKATDTVGKPVALRPGMRLEYWLEAADNCDYPRPNKGESKHKWVQIVEPLTDKQQQQQQRDQAQSEQQKHETDQDRQLQQDQQSSEGNGQKSEAKAQQGTEQDKQEAKAQQGGAQGQKADDSNQQGTDNGPKVERKPQQGADGNLKTENESRRGTDGSQKAVNQDQKGREGDREAETRPQKGRNEGQKVEDKGQKGADSEQQEKARGQKIPNEGQKSEHKGQEPEKSAGPATSDRVEQSRRKLDELVKVLEERDNQQAAKAPGKKERPDKKPKDAERSPQPAPSSNKTASSKGTRDKDQTGGQADQSKPEQEKKQPDAGTSDSQRPADQKQPGEPGPSTAPPARKVDQPPARPGDAPTTGTDKTEDGKPGPATGPERAEKEERPPGQKAPKDGQPGEAGGKPQDGKPLEPKDAKAQPGDSRDTPPTGASPDPRHQEKAGELQLERRIAQLRQELRKQLDAMTPEERRKLFEQISQSTDKPLSPEERERHSDRARKELERLVASPLPSLEARPAVPGQAWPGDAKRGDTGQPPADFREAYYNFLRKLAETSEK